MKIAVYCRVGSIDQLDVDEVINCQKQLAEDFKIKNCIEGKLKYYIDLGYSGTDLDRPKLNNLIKDIENRQINTIIVKSIGLLFRNRIDFLNFYKKIVKPYNVKIISMDNDFIEECELYDRIATDILEAMKKIKKRDRRNRYKMRLKK